MIAISVNHLLGHLQDVCDVLIGLSDLLVYREFFPNHQTKVVRGIHHGRSMRIVRSSPEVGAYTPDQFHVFPMPRIRESIAHAWIRLMPIHTLDLNPTSIKEEAPLCIEVKPTKAERIVNRVDNSHSFPDRAADCINVGGIGAP